MSKKSSDDVFADEGEVEFVAAGAAVMVKTSLPFVALKDGDAWAPRVNPDGSMKTATIGIAQLRGPEIAAIVAEALGLPAGRPYTINGAITLGIKREGLKAEAWEKAILRGKAHKAATAQKQAAARAASGKGL